MSENKKSFTVEVDGKDVELAVVRPSQKVQQHATVVYNREFRLATTPADGKPGALVRKALERVLREQKLWDDAKQAQFEALNKRLLDNEKKLSEGGIKLKEARAIAIKMREDRWELRKLLSDRNALDMVTADAQADNAKFNYLVSACTVKADGKLYWKTEEEYLADSDGQVAIKAAQILANMIYGLDEDFEQKLPENKFLAKYKFCDDKLRLVNKDGKFIDADGRLIDDKGRYINEAGEYVDLDGNLLTAEGDFKVEFKEFLDDDGVPVAV